jgi:hypothetical protein
MAIAAATHRGSSVTTAQALAEARACIPVSHHIARSSGSPGSVMVDPSLGRATAALTDMSLSSATNPTR